MAYSAVLMVSLESTLLEARDRVLSLQKEYEQLPDIPVWDDMSNTERFYSVYRDHVALMSLVHRSLVEIQAIQVEFKHYRLDSFDDTGGYSYATIQKMKKDVSHLMDYVDNIRSLLLIMKSDLDHKIKFLTNASYLLTSPYNIHAT